MIQRSRESAAGSLDEVVCFCKGKVCQFTNENCTLFKTEQNDITNEKWFILAFGEQCLFAVVIDGG